MKRVACSILAVLLAASVVWAGYPAVLGSTTKRGTAASDCPGGTYKFFWNGDHTSGSTVACVNSGASTSTGTQTGGDISGTGGYAGNGFRKTANNQNILWTVTGDDLLDDTIGTTWLRIRCSSGRTSAARAIEAYNAADVSNNGAYIQINSTNDQNVGAYEGNATSQSVSNAGVIIVDNAWTYIGYTWNTGGTAGQQHCVADADESWVCQDTLTAMNNVVDRLVIGENVMGGGETTADYICDIDEVYVYATYQTASPF